MEIRDITEEWRRRHKSEYAKPLPNPKSEQATKAISKEPQAEAAPVLAIQVYQLQFEYTNHVWR